MDIFDSFQFGALIKTGINILYMFFCYGFSYKYVCNYLYTNMFIISKKWNCLGHRTCICFNIVLVTFLSLWPNAWEKQFKRGRIYFGSWFLEVSIHHGGEGMVEQRISSHEGQQVERESTYASWISLLFLFIPSCPQTMGWCAHTQGGFHLS
jgi:hypothetical protein